MVLPVLQIIHQIAVHKKVFPSDKEVLNVSLIAVTLPGMIPPFFVHARLQQYCRNSFLYSAYRSFNIAIYLRTMRC